MFRSLAIVLALFSLPAAADPPRVVADIAPVHSLVAQVMQGVGDPTLLLAQDANPHAVQLRPSQARALAQADLVIWVGPALSPWLSDALDSLATARQIALMDHPASILRAVDGQDEDADHDEHGDEHADGDEHGDDHADGDDHDDHGHDHGAQDPHLWLSVDNARAWLPAFADALAEVDPDNAATYHANAAAAQGEIDALVDRIDARLAPHQGAPVLTFHAAFGYFADRFEIDVVGSVRASDATAPSAAALSELRHSAAERGVVCAFAEPAFDPGLLTAIAGETGLRIGTLDPTGVAQPVGTGHYGATLWAIADAIATCLEAR